VVDPEGVGEGVVDPEGVGEGVVDPEGVGEGVVDGVVVGSLGQCPCGSHTGPPSKVTEGGVIDIEATTVPAESCVRLSCRTVVQAANIRGASDSTTRVSTRHKLAAALNVTAPPREFLPDVEYALRVKPTLKSVQDRAVALPAVVMPGLGRGARARWPASYARPTDNRPLPVQPALRMSIWGAPMLGTGWPLGSCPTRVFCALY